jgi:uncharacterized membrane protein (Fun14 family)
MSHGQIESKFMRVLLIVIGAVFVFAGPTYLPLIMNEALNIEYTIAVSVGFVVFLIGVFDVIYLARKGVIT